MKDTFNGEYYRVFRAEGGMFGVEQINVTKGKVTSIVEFVEPTFPTIAMARLGKQAFAEAQTNYDIDSTKKV